MTPSKAGSARAFPVWALPVTVALLAIAARALALPQLFHALPFHADTVEGFDQHTYRIWAKQIAEGDILSRAQGVFYYAPLYPYLLAPVFAVVGEDSVTSGVVLNAALGVAAAVAAAGLARALWGDIAGAIAGVLLALSAPQIAHEALLLNDAALPALALGALWAIVAALEDGGRGHWRWIVAGVLLGLLIVGRGSNVLPAWALTAALAVLCLRDGVGPRRRRLVPVAVLVAAMAVPVGLVVARNRAVGGRWALTENGPVNLYIGNAPEASGTFSHPPGFDAADRAIRRLPRAERPAAWSARLASDWAAYSGGDTLLRVLLRKAGLFANAWLAPDNASYDFLREHVRALRWLVGAWPLHALGLAGLWTAWRSGPRGRLLVAFAIAFALSIIVVFVAGRYKLPWLALAAVLGGGALARAFAAARQGDGTPAVVTAAILAGALIITRPEVPALDRPAYAGLLRPNEFAQNIAALARAGRPDEADAMAARAQELFPGIGRFREQRIALAAQGGRWETVLALTTPALQGGFITRTAAEAHVIALARLRREAEAVALARQLVPHFPESELLRRAASLDDLAP